MQIELEALQPQLKVAAAETNKMMKIIQQETQQVEKAKALVEEDEKAATMQAKEATALKTECEADLAVALPILEGLIFFVIFSGAKVKMFVHTRFLL